MHVVGVRVPLQEGSFPAGARHVSPIGAEEVERPGQTYQKADCSFPTVAEISSTLRQRRSNHVAYRCMDIASRVLHTDHHMAERQREHEAGKVGIAFSRDREPSQQQKEARMA
jgi:hypothetical protein